MDPVASNMCRNRLLQLIDRFGFIVNTTHHYHRQQTFDEYVANLPLPNLARYLQQPSNLACHNLCTYLHPPNGFEQLLGLGLNYCLQPTRANPQAVVNAFCTRFERDLFTKMYFTDKRRSGEEEEPPPQLFLRSNFTPPRDEILTELRARTNRFLSKLKGAFATARHRTPPRRRYTNLSPFQSHLLDTFSSSTEFIVFPSDKNLGPAILERDEYIRRAMQDHLLDRSTYQQLTESEAKTKLHQTKLQVLKFLKRYGTPLSTTITSDLSPRSVPSQPLIDRNDTKFLLRSIDQCEDPFAYFYITAKVHKNPWKTRPIVSYPGSLLHGLGRWIDKELQPVCRHLPTYIESSFSYKQKLERLNLDWSRAKLFTADATSMYTNIDTDHAISELQKFFATDNFSVLHPEFHAEPILHALKLINTTNTFKFGDTFWLQLNGTAMGAPPACSYATLYFYLNERKFLPRFAECLPFYGRYIDDASGVWLPPLLWSKAYCQHQWEMFQAAFPFGKLSWTFSDLSQSINFLDLHVRIDGSRVKTTLYEKPQNLYLYLPAGSAHPPGLLRGTIIGAVRRIYRLTSSPTDRHQPLLDLFNRFQARGHPPSILQRYIFDAIKHLESPNTARDEAITSLAQLQEAPYFLTNKSERKVNAMRQTILLHVPYNNLDPCRHTIQSLFKRHLLLPFQEDPLWMLQQTRYSPRLGTQRLLVAYNKQCNLRQILFSRRLKDPQRVSTLLHSITHDDEQE